MSDYSVSVTRHIVVKDGVITSVRSGPPIASDGTNIVVPDSFDGHVGNRVEEFDENWRLLPWEQRGVPEGFVLEADGSLRERTLADDVSDGTAERPKGYKLETDEDGKPSLEPMMFDEMLAVGDITEAEWFDLVVREERNMLLADTDYLMLPDYPISDAKRDEFVAYRQLLRDLPSTISPPNVVWPQKPTIE